MLVTVIVCFALSWYFHGWVVGKLESNSKLNSKVKVEVEVEVGVELGKISGERMSPWGMPCCSAIFSAMEPFMMR